jgi:hypothetical protein
MSLANRLWGAPRIDGKLLRLGIEVAQSTVAKYMARSGRGRSQTWKTLSAKPCAVNRGPQIRGNGIPRPRDRPPKIAFRPETVSAETETQPQEPAKCGLLGRLPEICRFERLRGGGCTPDRTSLHLKFPANREINREFCRFRRSAAILASSRRANSMTSSEIPYATEQGIFAGPNREFFSKNRELPHQDARTGNSTSDQF